MTKLGQDVCPKLGLTTLSDFSSSKNTMLVITHLSIDWSTEGVATGGEVGARVLVLEHDLAVSVPEVPLAHNSPNISGVSISSLAKRRNLLPKATIIFSWVIQG